MNIETGHLETDLDNSYDKENNKIDVYSSVYWTADNEKEYTNKEEIINSYKKENELFKLNCWCDISGFNYWVIQQEEENYVSIDVWLKKQPSEYTNKELTEIREAIITADNYFDTKL